MKRALRIGALIFVIIGIAIFAVALFGGLMDEGAFQQPVSDPPSGAGVTS